MKIFILVTLISLSHASWIKDILFSFQPEDNRALNEEIDRLRNLNAKNEKKIETYLEKEIFDQVKKCLDAQSRLKEVVGEKEFEKLVEYNKDFDWVDLKCKNPIRKIKAEQWKIDAKNNLPRRKSLLTRATGPTEVLITECRHEIKLYDWQEDKLNIAVDELVILQNSIRTFERELERKSNKPE